MTTIRSLLVLACILVCQNSLTASEEPTFEKLSEFIGKDKKDLEDRFGPADSRKTGVFPSSLDENSSRAEIDKYLSQKPVRILKYGEVSVLADSLGEVKNVCHGDFEVFAPEEFEEPTLEKLKEYIDKDETGIFRRFGPPENVWECSCGLPKKDASDEFVKDWFCQPNPTYGFVYGDIEVEIHFLGRVMRVSQKGSGTFTSAEPTAEILKEYIGKTEKELRYRFGQPDSVETRLPPLPPENASDEEIERFWEQTPERIFIYGDINVDINKHGRIVEIR